MDFRLGLIYYPLKGKVRGGLAFPLTRDVKVTGKAFGIHLRRVVSLRGGFKILGLSSCHGN